MWVDCRRRLLPMSSCRNPLALARSKHTLKLETLITPSLPRSSTTPTSMHKGLWPSGLSCKCNQADPSPSGISCLCLPFSRLRLNSDTEHPA